MAILVVGDANADLTALVTRFPAEGDDSPVSALAWGSGGSAANVATALARLGTPTRLVARVGRDPSASVALAAAREAGVDLSAIQVDDAVATGLCYAAISPGGERTFFAYRGANRWMQTPDDTALAGIDWLHIAGHALLDHVQAASTEALLATTTLPVSLDLCLPLLRERRAAVLALLPRLAVVFANQPEFVALHEDVGSGRHFEALLDRVGQYNLPGETVMAVKCGARGSIVVDRSGVRHVPAFSVEAIDTNGCGDGFVAGFLTHLRGGAQPVACAQYGNAVGALAATRHGAAESLPSAGELALFLETRYVTVY
ncbi:MAG TPA: carbohydrate kinase family protein [Roseiflexaceae bacterium]|nr:carbohydrate kinase family protein [Roseiflexaceae bacterium]